MSTQPQKIQVVWDTGAECTAQSPSGNHLRVGADGDWTPELLLLAAAESSLMKEFVELARDRHLEVLGYVSSASMARPDHAGRHVRLIVRPCVAIARESDRPLAHELLARAHAISPVARALGRSFRLAPEVMLLPQEAPSP